MLVSMREHQVNLNHEDKARFLTLQDLSELLRIKERTLYQWAQQGKLPAFKLGNQWRFDRQEIDIWIEEQKRNTPRRRDVKKEDV